ncbi:zinc-binding dehydrogenase [Streptomyces sp. NPDC002172]
MNAVVNANGHRDCVWPPASGRSGENAPGSRRTEELARTTSCATDPRPSQLTALAEQGVLSVHVADTFPLRAAADAQRRSQQGHTRGKLVVTVDWPEEG